MTVQERICHMRKHRRMTMMELAERSNVSIDTICAMRKGEHKPQQRTLKNLAKALNVTVEYLINGGADDELPESYKEVLADNVVKARKEKGWNRMKLSEMSGVCYTTLRNIELGLCSTNRKHIEKIAWALKMPPNELTGENKYGEKQIS